MRRITVNAEIDPSDVLYELTDDQIFELLDSMDAAQMEKLLKKRGAAEHDPLVAYVDEAIDFLRAGRADDALLTLERSAHPKFPTIAAFEARMRRRAN